MIILVVSRMLQQFLKYENLEPNQYDPVTDAPFVTVVVPARNEEKNILKCLTSLASQDYPKDRYKIVVVDDDSSDGTPQIIEEIKSKYAFIESVRVERLPEGWAGKSHACWCGAQAAEGDWICFVDADTESRPNLLTQAIGCAVSRSFDFLSLNPFQTLRTFFEKCIMPSTFFIYGLKVNIHKVINPKKKNVASNGQFILIRKSVYDILGGHMAIRSKVVDDAALARLVKHSGYKVFWMGAYSLIKVRMYTNADEVFKGFTKNAVFIIGNGRVPAAVFQTFMTLMYAWVPVILPVLNLGNTLLFIISLAETLLLYAIFAGVLMHLRIPVFYIFAFPFGLTGQFYINIRSILAFSNGRIMWKNRQYPKECG